MKKMLEKKRAASMLNKKGDRNSKISESTKEVRRLMQEKNIAIRVKAVNEVPPMTGFCSQNLFKLARERRFRPAIKSNRTDSADQNVTYDLLQKEDDDEISECETKTQKQHLADYHKYKELNKSENDIRNMDEWNKLQADREAEQKRLQDIKRTKSFQKALKADFRKKKKEVDLS